MANNSPPTGDHHGRGDKTENGHGGFSDESDICVSDDVCDTLVRLKIVPDHGCVLTSIRDGIGVIQHNFKDGQCEVVVRRHPSKQPEIIQGGTIDLAACPLLLMQEYDITPSVTDVVEDGFVVNGYVPETGLVWPMLDELEEITTDFSVRKIVPIEEWNSSVEQFQVDLGELTEKQREALELAFAEGYFQRPRETNQAELASKLDISKQAFSRRLARAERTLLEQILSDHMPVSTD